jgi:hypothetical protein
MPESGTSGSVVALGRQQNPGLPDRLQRVRRPALHSTHGRDEEEQAGRRVHAIARTSAIV